MTELELNKLQKKATTHTTGNEDWRRFYINKDLYYVARSGVVSKSKSYADALDFKLAEDAHCVYVAGRKHHEIMAEAFLGSTKGDNLDIHHIDNNVLNMSIYNLMLVDRKTHDKIHFKN
jgi:hypothetical protein